MSASPYTNNLLNFIRNYFTLRLAFATPAHLHEVAYVQAPFGWTNVVTDSVSGLVRAEMTTCPIHRAIPHACPLCKYVVMRHRKPRNLECDRMSYPQIFLSCEINTAK